MDSLTSKPHARTVDGPRLLTHPDSSASDRVVRALCRKAAALSVTNLTALSHVALALQIQLTKTPLSSLRVLSGVPPFPNPTGTTGLSTMEMPSTSPFSRQRGRAPGALSHMVSANLRARALAPIIREIWAAGYMSYNALSRELNRRQVPTLRGGKKWYPMTAGRLLVRLERTGLIRIRRQSACSLLEFASRESRSTQRRCDRSPNVVEEVWLAGAVA